MPLLLLACATERGAPPISTLAGDRGKPVPTLEVTTLPPSSATAPAARVTSPASSTSASQEDLPQTRVCQCDFVDFESEGPAASRCLWEQAADGSGRWIGDGSSPKFFAALTPLSRGPNARAVDYVFEGAFDFACKKRWCGKQQLSVLQVHPNDFRVVVDRQDDGPPRTVLWFTCAK